MNANETKINALQACHQGVLTVAHTLRSGFVENVLAYQLCERDLAVAQQHGVIVSYDDANVAETAADFPVEAALAVELKAVKALDEFILPDA